MGGEDGVEGGGGAGRGRGALMGETALLGGGVGGGSAQVARSRLGAAEAGVVVGGVEDPFHKLPGVLLLRLHVAVTGAGSRAPSCVSGETG